MKVFDLTLPLHPGVAVRPGDPSVTFQLACSHERDGFQVTQLCLGSHSGTHLDAPRHFFPEGATMDQYPVERLVGPGVVVDCRFAGKRGGNESSSRGFLAEQLLAHPIPRGGFVILWLEGGLVDAEAAELLLELGVSLVGTDGPSLDEPPYPVHRLLLKHGVLLAENLSGLETLGVGPANFAFLPLALVGADGAPVRAIAWRD